MNRFSRYSLLVFSFLLMLNVVQAQDKRSALEKERNALRAEIRQINKLLNTNEKKKHSVLNKASDLDRRIKATEKLIRTNNQEANLLTNKINSNQKKISTLRKELKALKDDYAAIMRKSYKSRSKQSRIMFLFSSTSFLQAYKRLQYMKQYSNYREKQGEKIKAETKALQELNAELSEQRKAKEKLLAQNRATRKKLEKDKKQQEALMATINKKGSKYRSEIKQKQQQITKIDAEIHEIIRKAIAAENKKEGSSSSSAFKLTPEAKALAASFEANKGKLPWPLKSGNIVVRFGRHPSPLVKNIPIESHGIRIQTNKLEPVYVIFDGKVISIQAIKGSNKAILVQHGNYISIYNNLAQIEVHTGDIVTTGQEIGKVGKSTTTQRPTLSFQIYKNNQALDPLHWILRR